MFSDHFHSNSRIPGCIYVLSRAVARMLHACQLHRRF